MRGTGSESSSSKEKEKGRGVVRGTKQNHRTSISSVLNWWMQKANDVLEDEVKAHEHGHGWMHGGPWRHGEGPQQQEVKCYDCTFPASLVSARLLLLSFPV